MGLGPFDLNGGQFLALYAVLLGLAALVGFILPRWLRPQGADGQASGADQLAYLAGGKARFVDAVITRMLAAGQLKMEGKAKARILASAGAAGSAERSVFALPTPATWPKVMQAIGRQVPDVEGRLISAGLLMDRATTTRLRFWQTTPYVVVALFGAIKWEVGMLRERPVGYLGALLLLTLFFSLLRFLFVDRRTRNGIAAVLKAQGQSERLRRAPTNDETALAVALFGTPVLAGSAFGDYHTLRAATSSADGSMPIITGGSGDSDSGGSSDGGGDGGGGCGGCSS